MALVGRSFAAGTQYRYGFNGQEKSEKIGEGLNTATFWEYDSRIGRRWNPEPRPTVGISDYATYFNSPIVNNDIHGDSPSTGTRIWGAIKMIGGGIEAVAGGVGGVVTAETGVGAVAGYAVLAHGCDNASSGFMQMWSGEETQTYTEKGISAGLQAVGVSKGTSDNVAGVSNSLLTYAFTLGFGVPKPTPWASIPAPTAITAASKFAAVRAAAAKARSVIGKTRNVATVEGTVAGQQITGAAVSGESMRIGAGLFEMPTSTIFKTTVVNHSRAFDAEVKIFENLAKMFGKGNMEANRQVFGKVLISSELPLCPSCSDVINQFKSLFPNIQVSYLNGIDAKIPIVR